MHTLRLLALLLSVLIFRNKFDLDYVLEQGDRVFKKIGVYQTLALYELPHDISIKGTHVSAEMLVRVTYLWKKDIVYLHVLVSVLKLCSFMLIYLILTVVIEMVFMIQMESKFY